MDTKEVASLLLRYALVVLLPLGGLVLFYTIFTPLTLYSAYFILKFMYSQASLLPPATLFLQGEYINIVSACIAGAAYYLLVALNLTTPMHPLKRVKSLAYLVLVFLFLNVLRIVIFAKLFISGTDYFDLAHKVTWYFGSTLLIVLVWFSMVLIFKIQAIPVYTDVRNILRSVQWTSPVGKKAVKK